LKKERKRRKGGREISSPKEKNPIVAFTHFIGEERKGGKRLSTPTLMMMKIEREK